MRARGPRGRFDYAVEEFEHANDLWAITLQIDYQIEPYHPQTRDSPAEGGGVEFTAVVKTAIYCVDDFTYEARPEELQAIQDAWDEREGYYQPAIDEKCREHAEDADAAGQEAAAEARRDAMLDREWYGEYRPQGAD